MNRRDRLARATRRREEQRGAILLVSSIMMIMLLLFSAIAIDIGMLMTARRQDQNAVDAAVIAGTPHRSDEAVLAQTILDSLNDNLGGGLTLVHLNGCDATEPLPSSSWARYPTYNCIAHNQSYTEIWLRLPTQSIPSIFSGLGEIQSFDHTAFAQAGDDPISANVLPIAIDQAAAGSSYDCLKAGANDVPDSNCSDSSSGNFGRVIFGLWGNEQMGTTRDCTGTKMYEINLAQGLDHDLSRYGASPHNNTQIVDTHVCGSTPAPNAMTTDTGNVPSDTYDGLLSGDVFPDGRASRLTRLGPQSYMTTVSVNGETVDSTPLWEFIDRGLGSSDDVPRSCWYDNFDQGISGVWSTTFPPASAAVRAYLATFSQEDRAIKLMQRCLDHYRGLDWDDAGGFSPADPMTGCASTSGCTDPVFSRNNSIELDEQYDIQQSPRFAYVPVIASFPSGTSSTVNIIRFKAVYLHRAYGGNCNSNGCQFVFDPGFTGNHNGTDKVNALTAFVLPDLTLPNGLGGPDAPSEYGKTKFVRLTR